MISKPLIN